jgi:hypothetical protein
LFARPFFSHSQSIDVFVGNTTSEISGSVYDIVSSSVQEDLSIQIENYLGTDQVWKIERVLSSTKNWSDSSVSWGDLSNPLNGDNFIVSAARIG